MRTKFRAWDKDYMHGARMEYFELGHYQSPSFLRECPIMQFTGLHDKNGLAEIYEGDIIDANGILKGNIYESPQIYQEGIDCLIEGMGTETWGDTESIAVGRGCKYTKQ